MQTLFPSFPHLYDPPADVARQLRDVEPTAELLYFGWGLWHLVRHDPDSRRRSVAARALWGHTEPNGTHSLGAIERLQRWWTVERYTAVGRKAFTRDYRRYLRWLAEYQGARFIAEYAPREIRAHGFEYIVFDYRRMLWMYAQERGKTSEHAVDQLFNGERDAMVEASRRELSDEHKALSMQSWLARNPVNFTSSAPVDAGRSSVLIRSASQ